MTQYSYSRVDLFERCPYHFKLRYIDKLTELPRYAADNPLILGHALHKGIELGVQAMHDDYYNAYPVITNEQVNEMIKLEMLLTKVETLLNDFTECEFRHEYRISTTNFLGFADLILTAPDGTSSVIDFKYSNHIENYMKSGQLHLYKYFLEKQGFNVSHLGYIFIPKTGIRQKKTEDLYQFRQRLVDTVSKQNVQLVTVPYDKMNVLYFKNNIEKIEAATEYPKNPNGDCFACNPRFAPQYLEAIQNEKGEILMQLPKNVRSQKQIDTKPDVWLYADSYVGKTTFWDKFDNVLMINTDGNTDNITSPVFHLKDEVTKEGRMTKRKFAWDTFLDIITELEAGNDEGYQTIVIDLMEDLRDHCRNYIFDKYNWEHESDGSYGKGWSMVNKEFDNAIKRLKNVGLQIVYISKELRQDVTLKGGSVRTTFKPNIDDKTANFLTGTVDATLRAYVNDEGQHMLQLKKETGVFGGGRFGFKQTEIPLDKDAFIEALESAQDDRGKSEREPAQVSPKVDETTNDETEDEPEKAETPKPKRARRTRKPRTDDEDNVTPPGEDEPAEVEEEEKPKPRRCRRRESKSEE